MGRRQETLKAILTAVHTCSIGTLTASIVHPREVFKVACVGNASGIILLHNHPSGDPLPSEEDKRITSRIEEAGQLMGISSLGYTSPCYYWQTTSATSCAGSRFQEMCLIGRYGAFSSS